MSWQRMDIQVNGWTPVGSRARSPDDVAPRRNPVASGPIKARAKLRAQHLPLLDPEFSRDTVTSCYLFGRSTQKEVPIEGVQLAMLRQMAYEVLPSPALWAMAEDSERVAGRELSGLQRRRRS